MDKKLTLSVDGKYIHQKHQVEFFVRLMVSVSSLSLAEVKITNNDTITKKPPIIILRVIFLIKS